MKKRVLSIILACLLTVSVLAGSMISASAAEGEKAKPNPYRLPEYTPSAGVETTTVYFAMPGSWTNDVTKAQDNAAGAYWWSGLDNPDDYPDASGHGWPGWKMKKVTEDGVENLNSTAMPVGTPNLIFSNFIDGGMDETYPEYNSCYQTKDLSVECFAQGDSDYYPLEFWDYLFDNYGEDFDEDPDFLVPEFGDYAKNFHYTDLASDVAQFIDNMVYVVDYNPDRMQISPVSGKGGFDGAFYFYYGNGEFGIWPTRELCIEKEGLTTDADGKIVYEGTKKNAETGEDEAFTETVDEKTGFILREHTDAYDGKTKRNFVVFGNFTGKYWGDTTPPETPTQAATDAPATTVPGADNKDATSATGSGSNSGTGSNNSNGSIATSESSVFAFVAVALIAGVGVFYFVRRRRTGK